MPHSAASSYKLQTEAAIRKVKPPTAEGNEGMEPDNHLHDLPDADPKKTFLSTSNVSATIRHDEEHKAGDPHGHQASSQKPGLLLRNLN